MFSLRNVIDNSFLTNLEHYTSWNSLVLGKFNLLMWQTRLVRLRIFFKQQRILLGANDSCISDQTPQAITTPGVVSFSQLNLLDNLTSILRLHTKLNHITRGTEISFNLCPLCHIIFLSSALLVKKEVHWSFPGACNKFPFVAGSIPSSRRGRWR